MTGAASSRESCLIWRGDQHVANGNSFSEKDFAPDESILAWHADGLNWDEMVEENEKITGRKLSPDALAARYEKILASEAPS